MQAEIRAQWRSPYVRLLQPMWKRLAASCPLLFRLRNRRQRSVFCRIVWLWARPGVSTRLGSGLSTLPTAAHPSNLWPSIRRGLRWYGSHLWLGCRDGAHLHRVGRDLPVPHRRSRLSGLLDRHSRGAIGRDAGWPGRAGCSGAFHDHAAFAILSNQACSKQACGAAPEQSGGEFANRAQQIRRMNRLGQQLKVVSRFTSVREKIGSLGLAREQ
jgi:hypothetical protein